MNYALVTGGSRGIGRAVCIRLAQMGHPVLINYMSNDAAAEETLRACREANPDAEAAAASALLKFDVGSASASREALEAWLGTHKEDYIGILVNNAGIRRDNILALMPQEDFEKVLTTNLFSFYHVTQPLMSQMIAHKDGRIVNMASVSGMMGLPGQCNYSAAKGGLIAATKALAKEVGRRKITVNAVAPGFVRTDMVEGLDEAELKKTIPMNRFAEPEEVAALVGFLCSKEAGYITGQCISINGGLYA